MYVSTFSSKKRETTSNNYICFPIYNQQTPFFFFPFFLLTILVISIRRSLGLQAVKELLLLRGSIVNGQYHLARFTNFETVAKNWFFR